MSEMELNEVLVEDLSQRATNGELEPAYGRSREMLTILEILVQSDKGNVLLVGHPGVGKTRILEGIAVAGAKGETEGLLEDIRIVKLHIGTLSSGRKEWEARLISLLTHLRNNRDTVLFIDDIDLVIAENAPEAGVIDFGRTLRPALMRQELTAIGAMTPEKYLAYVKGNSQWESRFEVVFIEPMTEAHAYEVLENLRPSLEEHHGIEISDDALHAAIALSEQHMHDKFLPGKAIKVLDRACARYRVKGLVQRKFAELSLEDTVVTTELSPRDIKRAIERSSGVKLPQLPVLPDTNVLEQTLTSTVLGQDPAVRQCVRALEGARKTLADHLGPKLSLVFAGPPGVGKKLLARELARSQYGDESKLLTIDGRSFDEEAFVRRLTGIGEAQGASPLIAAEMIRPEYAVLVENIESADRRTLNFFTSLLEMGRLGEREELRTVVLRACIFVFTTNLDLGHIDEKNLSVSMSASQISFRQQLPSAFTNLVDAVIPFEPLSEGVIRDIMRRPIHRFRDEISAQGLALVMRDSAYKYIAEKGFNKNVGARDLEEMVQELVVDPVRDMITRKGLHDMQIHVLPGDNGLQFRRAERDRRT